MAKKTNCEINGKKYFRISLTIGYDDNGKQKQKYFYGKTKKEAEDKKQEYLLNLNKGITNNKIYLSQALRSWLFEIVKPKVKESTFERYEGIYRNYIKDSEIGLLEVKSISKLVIQKHYNKLSKNKSISQIKNLNKLLKSFFFYCIDEDIIYKNPCCRIVFNDNNVNNNVNKNKVFNADEIQRIIVSKPCISKYLGLLCLSTGLRRGEALGLKWSDINYKDKSINIERSVRTIYTIDDNGNRICTTKSSSLKTNSSYRTIPLSENLIILFTEIKEFMNERKIKAKEYYNSLNNDYIFTSVTGGLIDSSNLSRAWKRYLNRVGIEYKNFHCTRHTYITIQYENNIKALTISKLVGHSNTNITESVYTHISQKEIKKSVDVLDIINKNQ